MITYPNPNLLKPKPPKQPNFLNPRPPNPNPNPNPNPVAEARARHRVRNTTRNFMTDLLWGEITWNTEKFIYSSEKTGNLFLNTVSKAWKFLCLRLYLWKHKTFDSATRNFSLIREEDLKYRKNNPESDTLIPTTPFLALGVNQGVSSYNFNWWQHKTIFSVLIFTCCMLRSNKMVNDVWLGTLLPFYTLFFNNHLACQAYIGVIIPWPPFSLQSCLIITSAEFLSQKYYRLRIVTSLFLKSLVFGFKLFWYSLQNDFAKGILWIFRKI